jgi:hypothetical protein
MAPCCSAWVSGSRMRIALILSIILHLAFLASLKGRGGGGFGDGNGDGRKIVPKSSEPIEVTSGDLGFREPRKKKKIDPKCKEFYGGIGVEYSHAWGVSEDGGITVDRVPVGYPAYDAGIKPGDVIYTTEEVRGEVGTQITIKVMHADKSVENITMTRAKICLDPPEIKKPK